MKAGKMIIMTLILLVLRNQGLGQTQERNKKMVFSSINQVALSFGNGIDKQIGTGIFTTNGIRNDKWFAGVGFGYQQYAFNSLPIYVQVERKLLKGKEGGFLYVNGGANLLIDKNQIPAVVPVSSISKYQQKSGFWGEFGYSYRALIFKKIPLQFHFAYNRQTVPTIEISQSQIPGLPVIVKTYTYKFQVILVKVGIYLS